MTTSYPPIHHHSSARVSSSKALSLLSAYLEAASTDPSLHPNALLTENGPITPSSSANTGLVLHNLRRVEAGLRGEHLGTDLIFEKLGGENLRDMTDEATVAGAKETSIGGLQTKGKELEQEGWQDKEEFEREQDVMQGEIGRRSNAIDDQDVGQSNRVPKVKATKARDTNWDKQARKQAKRERKLQERKTFIAMHSKNKGAEGMLNPAGL